MYVARITYLYVFPQYYDKFMPFVILMRRRHLDLKKKLVFPKRVMVKRENYSMST